MTDTSHAHLTDKDGVVTVTFNRPDKHNAISDAMSDEEMTTLARN